MDRHHESSYAIFSLFRLLLPLLLIYLKKKKLCSQTPSYYKVHRLYVVLKYFSGQVFQRPMINGL